MNELLKLIAQEESTDQYGGVITTETSREVFCRVQSIGQKEFYESQAVGMQPDIKVTIADYYDYDGETLVELDGIRYRVLRTYRKGIELELTLTRGVIDDERT